MAKTFIRIGFIRTEQYESEGRHLGPVFTAGEVYDCTREFGERWINRNVAVELPAAKDPREERWVRVEKSDWTIPGGEGADDGGDAAPAAAAIVTEADARAADAAPSAAAAAAPIAAPDAAKA